MRYICTLTEEDGKIIAEFPDLPNILTYGETQEDALRMASEALNGALASDVARGMLPPVPREYPGNPIEVDPHVVAAIELRKLRGKASQSDIARKLGVTYQAYQRLENPTLGNPTIKTLEKVARVYGKSLEIRFS